MGMRYNITFHKAVIKPERFAEMLGTRATGDLSPSELAEMALDHVNAHISDYDGADQHPETGEIELDGLGYCDGAGYSYGGELQDLLWHCEPGAFIHETDAEEGTGEQWRHVKMPDGTVQTLTPTITWPAEAGEDYSA